MTIDEVEAWFDEHDHEFGLDRIRVSLARGLADRDPSSVVIDFESIDHSGRLVVWSDGQAQLNAGNTRTHEVALDEYRNDIHDRGVGDAVATILGSFR